MNERYHALICPVLVFCLDSVTYEVAEGAQSQHLDVALVCGKVGEFTVSLSVTTDEGTATGIYYITYSLNYAKKQVFNCLALAIACILFMKLAGLDYVPLLTQLSFSGNSTKENVLVDIKEDYTSEPLESFDVVILGVEISDASGIKQVLSAEDHGRIILGQKRAHVFILDGKSL